MLYITFYIFIVNYINILKTVTLAKRWCKPYRMWFILMFCFLLIVQCFFFNFQQTSDQFKAKETQGRQESTVVEDK